MHRKLNLHGGCVNTVSFNADGDILVSGSDDRTVILCDWDTENLNLFHLATRAIFIKHSPCLMLMIRPLSHVLLMESCVHILFVMLSVQFDMP